jgi:uncharacterized membrane protein
VLKLTATSKAKPGTYSVTVSAASTGSTTQRITLSVTIARQTSHLLGRELGI